MNVLRRILPIWEWLGEYGLTEARGDLLAGVTVGVMLIPQSMAYATLAGLPPIYGLYASLIPLVVFPIFATSRRLAVGTVAIDMMLIAGGLSGLAPRASAEYIQLAIVLTALVGGLQIVMGVLRLGFVANLLSRPVIVGLVTAAPIIIAASQLGSILGIQLPETQQIYLVLEAVWERGGNTSLVTAVIGFSAVAILLVVNYWKPLFPGALLVVVLGMIAGWGWDLGATDVQLVGDIPAGLPSAEVPPLSWSSLQHVLPTAIALAIVQFMNSMSLAKLFVTRDDPAVDANREVMALGLANVAGSFFRCLPISGSFSRSAVNNQAGAKTGLANIVTAGLIALTLLFLTPLFRHLPMAILGAIIVVACVNLINVRELRYLIQSKPVDGAVAILTGVIVLGVGVVEGILVGIGASIVAVMYRQGRPNLVELGHVPGTHQFRDLTRFPRAEEIKGVYILRMDASFTFVNMGYLKRHLLREIQARETAPRAIVLDCSSVNDLDTTAIEVFGEIIDELRTGGVDLYVTGITGPVRETFLRSGLKDKLGVDRFFMSPHRAVRKILSEWSEQDRYEAIEDEETYDREKDVFKDADRTQH